MECNKMYYESGKVRIEYYSSGGGFHREDGPAHIWYYENGNIMSEEYYINGECHREDGPSYIEYLSNGDISYKSYCLYDKQYNDKDIINNWEAFCKMQIFR